MKVSCRHSYRHFSIFGAVNATISATTKYWNIVCRGGC